jgi:dTDP-4-amino-4,6-dideoxygalactose transaminase
MTHIATAHAVEWVGARPVFVDADPRTGNVTPAGIEAALTPQTKAISVVHFQGIPCDMPLIMQLAERHGLRVIEDCALAVGGRIAGRHTGLFGDVGCFSLYPVKHFTAGEGGMLVSRRAELAAAVARLRAFGVDRRHDERTIPGMYDVPQLGLNYRMSELQAALARSQLSRIDEMLALRRRNFQLLRDGLSTLPNVYVLDTTDPHAENAHYALSLILAGPLAAHRNDCIRRLQQAGVGTSVYYPQPVPRMSWYARKYGYDARRYPVATQIADESIALPVGPHVSPDDVEYILDQVRNTLSELEP